MQTSALLEALKVGRWLGKTIFDIYAAMLMEQPSHGGSESVAPKRERRFLGVERLAADELSDSQPRLPTVSGEAGAELQFGAEGLGQTLVKRPRRAAALHGRPQLVQP